MLTGPRGHGKSLLLRSLWRNPPSGFAPIFVPFADVEPDQIAAQILSTTRTDPVHDAENALERLLSPTRAAARVRCCSSTSCSRCRARRSRICSRSPGPRTWRWSWSAAGVESEALHGLLSLLPRAPSWIAVEAPWTRADAERLLVRDRRVAAAGRDGAARGDRPRRADRATRREPAARAQRDRRAAAQAGSLEFERRSRQGALGRGLPPGRECAIPEPVAPAPEPEPATRSRAAARAGAPGAGPEPVPELRWMPPSPTPQPHARRPRSPPAAPAPPSPQLFVPQTALVGGAGSAAARPAGAAAAAAAGSVARNRACVAVRRRFSAARIGGLAAALAAAAPRSRSRWTAQPAPLASTQEIAGELVGDQLQRARDWAQREIGRDARSVGGVVGRADRDRRRGSADQPCA